MLEARRKKGKTKRISAISLRYIKTDDRLMKRYQDAFKIKGSFYLVESKSEHTTNLT